ncbi:MAG: YicC family protein [Clostridiaceae bacterium]|nr:YicC family protein [Clostridiaceae bacterium]
MKSMTGYGKSQITDNDLNVVVEIKSVNNRNRDLRIRLPHTLNPLELQFRKLLESQINRGSIDVYIAYEDLVQESKIKLDLGEAKGYLNVYQEIEELCDESINSKALLLARNNAVFIKDNHDVDQQRFVPVFEEAIKLAIEEFNDSRLNEGKHLNADLTDRIKSMQNVLAEIKEHADKVVDYHRQKLLERITDLLTENLEEYYDGQRVAAEMAIFADKADISEEITRLDSHLNQFNNLLQESSPIGKNLDFLVQEILRETNTIGSKANYLEITKLVVELKTNIEKIREQVQNIE